jgi:rSAM/selenodomain-associated transferase 2
MISIIVPVLNEADRLERFFERLGRQSGEWEVILADGGSRDASEKIAGRRARWVTSPPGRAPQMNAGAAAAVGDILLFLHCDTALPPGGLEMIEEAMRDENTAGGGFTHRFDRDDRFSRFISLTANTRARRWKLYFGDQAIFVRRRVFERLGGYAEMPLFEDWDLSARMRSEGSITLIEAPITTSARRIEVWGKRKCFTVWWGLSILYALGVRPEKLARYYEHIR